MQVVAQEVGGARQSATAKVEILLIYFQAMLNIADVSFHESFYVAAVLLHDVGSRLATPRWW